MFNVIDGARGPHRGDVAVRAPVPAIAPCSTSPGTSDRIIMYLNLGALLHRNSSATLRVLEVKEGFELLT